MEFFKKIVCSLFLLTGHLAFADFAMTDENGQTTLVFVIGDSVVIRECAGEVTFSDFNTQNRANCTLRAGSSDLSIPMEDFENMLTTSFMTPFMGSLGMPPGAASSAFANPAYEAKVAEIASFLSSYFADLTDVVAAEVNGTSTAEPLDLDRSSTPEYFGHIASFSDGITGDKKFNSLSRDEQKVLIDQLLLGIDFLTMTKELIDEAKGQVEPELRISLKNKKILL